MVVRTDNHFRRMSTLDPIHDAQHDAAVGLIGPVGTSTDDGTLTDLPRPGTPETVPHAGHHEQPIEVVHLVVTVFRSLVCAKIS